MQGNNPIRKPVLGDGRELAVKHIFPTLQGEGPYAGYPAVFVRLGGCNLACGFCDTDFEDFSVVAVGEIVQKVNALAASPSHAGGGSGRGHSGTAQQASPPPSLPPAGGGDRIRHLVVITGGEPLRQNIAPLCEALLTDGFKVQIETNGTLFRELPVGVDIICSPKSTGTGYHPLRDDLLRRTNALKFIISSRDEQYNHVPELGQSAYGIPVYVQPMDEYDELRNAQNRALAVRLAMQYGYRLSMQLHKILGIE